MKPSHTPHAYKPIKETYAGGSAFSIYGALKGNIRACRSCARDPSSTEECWCTRASNPDVILPVEGTRYPASLCLNCLPKQDKS